MDDRVRERRGSVDVHTSQRHPMTGTPVDVLVPRKVMEISGFNLARDWHNLPQSAKKENVKFTQNKKSGTRR